MLRFVKILRFRFSSSERFRAAENIILAIAKHNEHIQ